MRWQQSHVLSDEQKLALDFGATFSRVLGSAPSVAWCALRSEAVLEAVQKANSSADRLQEPELFAPLALLL